MSAVVAARQRMWAIALNTYREAVRNRVLYVLVMFAVALMAFSVVLGELSLHEEVRVMKDVGLAGLSFVSVAIALFLGVNLLSKELDKKTVYFVVPKPLHRWEFLVGKYVGLVVTLGLLVSLMSLTLWGFIAAQGGHHGVTLLRAEVLVLFELVLLTAVAMLFSSFSSPYLSAMFTGAFWVIGRNRAELHAFATGKKLEGTVAGDVLRVASDVLPDFHAFYVSGADLGDGIISIHESFVSWAYVASAASYGVAYAGACLVAAVLIFERRDLT